MFKMDIERSRQTILQSELDYYDSLLKDKIKDLKRDLAKQRKDIDNMIINSDVSYFSESDLPKDIQRLLRLNPKYLTPKEREEVEQLLFQLKHEKRCLNLSREDKIKLGDDIMYIEFPEKNGYLCFNVMDSLEQGLVNVKLGVVYAVIKFKGEFHLYPLVDEEVKEFLRKVREGGLDPSSYPQISYPDIEEVERNKEEVEKEMRKLRRMY
jgi:hypothetical protein